MKDIPILCDNQASFPIGVGHGRKVAPDQLEISVEFDVIGGHLEHAQMEISDGREGTTRDEHQGSFLRVIHLALQA